MKILNKCGRKDIDDEAKRRVFWAGHANAHKKANIEASFKIFLLYNAIKLCIMKLDTQIVRQAVRLRFRIVRYLSTFRRKLLRLCSKSWADVEVKTKLNYTYLSPYILAV
jgi:hypothetical protein